jgi:hypothetical protein
VGKYCIFSVGESKVVSDFNRLLYHNDIGYCLTRHHAMKTFTGVEVLFQAFLTLALDGGEWPFSSPGRFTPWKRAPGTHWMED